MTEADLMAGLHDIRLPVMALRMQIADLAAAIGLGLLLAILLARLAAGLTKRPARAPSVTDRLDDLSDLPGPDRQIALVKLLAETAPDQAARLVPDAYASGGLPAPEALERMIRAHA